MSLSQYIKDDLRNSLTSGEGLPRSLTLESLANHYSVSLTPVRSAVAELVDEGILKKGPNLRLKARANRQNGRRRHLPPTIPEPQQELFDLVANEIAQLCLEGQSIYVREVATAQQFDTSRSAIRSIFNRLTGAGLLEHIPRRGWRVRAFQRDDLSSFLEVREVLELKALDLAQHHLEETAIREIRAANILPATETSRPQIDDSLHSYIIQKSGNAYIADFFQRHGKFFDVLFVWETKDRQAALETIEQHWKILDNILDKKWDAAKEALSFHIRQNHPVLSELLPHIEGQPGMLKENQMKDEPAANLVRRSYEI